MIQRIQSVYLLLTAILMAVTVCSPLLILQVGEGAIGTFKCIGIYDEPFEPLYSTWGVLFFTVLSALLSFINIFLYKKRKVQMKVCNVVTLFVILFYVTIGVYFYTATSELGITGFTISYGIILPLIALIFNILACIKIKADEKLVQSLNRIR